MGGINAVALSRDETTVLTVGQEKRITFWDLREHHPVLGKVTTTEGTCTRDSTTLQPYVCCFSFLNFQIHKYSKMYKLPLGDASKTGQPLRIGMK